MGYIFILYAFVNMQINPAAIHNKKNRAKPPKYNLYLGAVTGVRRETPSREQPLRWVGAKLAGGKLSRGKFVARIALKVYSKCTVNTL